MVGGAVRRARLVAMRVCPDERPWRFARDGEKLLGSKWSRQKYSRLFWGTVMLVRTRWSYTVEKQKGDTYARMKLIASCVCCGDASVTSGGDDADTAVSGVTGLIF